MDYLWGMASIGLFDYQNAAHGNFRVIIINIQQTIYNNGYYGLRYSSPNLGKDIIVVAVHLVKTSIFNFDIYIF